MQNATRAHRMHRLSRFRRSFRSPLGCLVAAALLLFGGIATDAAAQTDAETAPPPDPSFSSNLFRRMRDPVMDMTQFFETTLPGTLQKYNLVLDFSPRFGDIRHREYIRYPLELRYGVSDTWELYTEVIPFSPNPINSGEDHRWGMGEVRLGVRHDTDKGFGFYDRATLGLETRIPVGNPPVDMIDGYAHLKPILTGSRRLHWPHFTLFTTFSYDRSIRVPSRRDPPDYVVRQHIAQVAPGILYKPGEYGLWFEYDFRHLDEDDGYRLSHGIRVGPIWDIPRFKTQKWKLPGKWQVELAYKVVKEEGRDADHGVSMRVRVRTTLREVMDSHFIKPLRLDR